MPDVNQYTVTLRDLIEILIKKSDVHEGNWALTVGWQIGTGTYGPSPEQSFPGIAATVTNVGIQRAAPGTPIDAPGTIIVDAAQVNPPPASKAVRKKKGSS
jgi:hypothetical protein